MYTIIAKTPLSHNVSRMEILAPPVARKALPGQFVILRAMEHSERIPLTVHDVNTQSGTVSMVYQVVGAGTRELDSLKAGGRTVGVISHVDAMKESIGAQLQVVRDPGGWSRVLPPA